MKKLSLVYGKNNIKGPIAIFADRTFTDLPATDGTPGLPIPIEKS